MTGEQHMFGLKVIVTVAVIAAVIAAGTGVYYLEKSSPQLKITSVSFKVNYIGNNSNYLDPALLSSDTGFPTRNMSQAFPMNLHKVSGKWVFSIVLTLGYNSSNSLFKSELANPLSENNSVVIRSIKPSTNAFSLAGNQTGNVVVPPFPYMPTSNSIVVLPFLLTSNGFDGPLTLTISAASPAAVLIPKLQVSVSQEVGSISNVSLFGNFSVDTYSYLGGAGVYLSGQTLSLSGIELESHSNFSAGSAVVNTPFSLTNEKFGNVYENGSGYYAMNVSLDVLTPSYFYRGYVNITIDVNATA